MENVKPDENNKELANEVDSELFPVVDTKETYYDYYDEPELKENIILHYTYENFHNNEKIERFKLLKIINGLHYIFSFSLHDNGSGSLLFKTEEYEYATTNLNKEGQKELEITIAGFLNSIAESGNSIKEINISPADASYSSEEIEDCMKAILASPENKFDREYLLREYKGFKIFDLYSEKFGKDFHETHYTSRSRAGARSRYFKKMFTKNLPNWEVADDEVWGKWSNDFILKPKEKNE